MGALRGFNSAPESTWQPASTEKPVVRAYLCFACVPSCLKPVLIVAVLVKGGPCKIIASLQFSRSPLIDAKAAGLARQAKLT